MKFEELPPHVTEVGIPPFRHQYYEKYPCEYDDYDIIPQFHIEWWDGAQSGVFTYNDTYFFATMIHDLDRAYWAAFVLPPEDLRRILDQNALFCKHVGTYTQYHGDRTIKHPASEHRHFYNHKDQYSFDYRNVEIFGIVENPFEQ